jgi:hypothetical protein
MSQFFCDAFSPFLYHNLSLSLYLSQETLLLPQSSAQISCLFLSSPDRVGVYDHLSGYCASFST